MDEGDVRTVDRGLQWFLTRRQVRRPATEKGEVGGQHKTTEVLGCVGVAEPHNDSVG